MELLSWLGVGQDRSREWGWGSERHTLRTTDFGPGAPADSLDPNQDGGAEKRN